MRDLSDLYYECHITIMPLPETWSDGIVQRAREDFVVQCGVCHFHLAQLYMDNGQPHGKDSFMTSRHKSYSTLFRDMQEVLQICASYGVKVIRYKIEDTIIDSRHQDILGVVA